MSGTVENLFIAPAGGEPMHAMTSVNLEEGRGIVGDRYHAGNGSFSDKLEKLAQDDWQITLIEREEIDRFLDEVDSNIGHGDFRRNVLTAGVRLNPLVGQRFVVDGIPMEGVRLCEPCAYLAGLLTDDLLPAMVGRAGLRARILGSGSISVGGAIEL